VEREAPLRQDELREVRRMIDEYRYDQERARRWRGRFGDARTTIVAGFAGLSLLIQAIGLYIVSGH
jgi:hypothetical protein